MDPRGETLRRLSRRAFLGQAAGGVGAAALGSLLGTDLLRGQEPAAASLPGQKSATAKRVVYLFQSGGPSHIDLFDWKPGLAELHGTELPPSVRGDQRITGMTSGQSSFPCVQPIRPFRQYGECGRWLSELIPHIGAQADRIALLKSVHTEAINHDPAVTFLQTGNQRMGYPSMGAWTSYGLGSLNDDLPSYVVLISMGSGRPNDAQALFSRLWGSGFLPSSHQGVQFRSGKDPVLYLNDPPGIDREGRRSMLDRLAELNAEAAQKSGDPETDARIAQYEMAYRMQTSVPDLMDLSDEPESTFERYGPDSRRPGSYAANCILARRMLERDVRFVQLFHRGWDQHGNLKRDLALQCGDTDQPSAAMVQDLAERGLLDDTLVVWSGEFGRSVYSQGNLQSDGYGRDHHGRCFSMWMAGGGVRGGVEHGATDDFSWNITEDPVHIRDVNATILNCLGLDHERLVYPYLGLDQTPTGVIKARVVDEVLAQKS
jgi:hypothetical protein